MWKYYSPPPVGGKIESSKEEEIVHIVNRYLRNNGNKTSISNVIMELQDKGFKAEDFKRLNKYKQFFDIDGPYITRLEAS